MTKQCHKQKLIATLTICLVSFIFFPRILNISYAATNATTKTPSQPASAPAQTNTTTAAPTPTPAKDAANIPLNQPNMKTDDVMKWAQTAVKAVYSYDFKNYKQQIQDTQTYFTDTGWKAFNDALAKSNNLKIVESKKLVASAVTNKPTLIEEGVKNGRYTWKLQMPIVASYENESKLIKQNLIITLLVSRTNSPPGVGISHFIAQIVPQNQQPPLTAPQPVNPTDSTTTTESKPPVADTPGATDTNNHPMNPTTTNNPNSPLQTNPMTNPPGQMNSTNPVNRP